MRTGKINYKAIGVLALFFCAMPIWSQVDSTQKQWGSFPKKEPKGTKNIQVNGKYVISPQFKTAGFFSDGLAAVEIGGKWG